MKINYEVIFKLVAILLIISKTDSLLSQIDIDTFHSSHSPFLEYETGFTLSYTNYSEIDFQKLKSSKTSEDQKNKIRSKYQSDNLEFIATLDGWINPLNLFKVQIGITEYFFALPSLTYKFELDKLEGDLVLINSDKKNLWKYDGQTITLVLHYKDSSCTKVEEFNSKIPYEFFLSEQKKGLHKFDVIIQNDLKHILKSTFIIW